MADRRLYHRLRLWTGLIGAVLALIVVTLSLLTGAGISVFSLVGLVVGLPLAWSGWRGLQRER